MAQGAGVLLEPRKRPVQARSAASVDAILVATVQVLLAVGKGRLTTTRVAARAGVSVGTLYQYFPNKSALLQAALQRKLDMVADAVEQACQQQRGKTAPVMGEALVIAFLAAKMMDVKASAAMYAVSSDLDGARVRERVAARIHKAIARMLASAEEPVTRDLDAVAEMLYGVMAGAIRLLLEGPAPEKKFPRLRDELVLLVRVYLTACVSASPSQ